MGQLIVLTKAQADAIRGHSSPFAAIEPVALKDGTFMIGEEVLTDPAHTARIQSIKALPKVERTATEALIVKTDLTAVEAVKE